MYFLDRLNEWTEKAVDLIWGVPLILLLISVGILFSYRLRLLQVRRLGKAFRYMFLKEEGGAGEVTSFGALCTALSATIGTGNIVGVATAICAGGPGALFWMMIAALVGMATQYAEGLLAVKYRIVAPDGHTLGGPFYYIERGMGKRWRWLAKLFSVFAVLAGLLGIGTFTQINSITGAVQNYFDPNFSASDVSTGLHLFGTTYSWAVVCSGVLVAACAALVIIGGIQRIAKVSEFVVPFMAILYGTFCLMVLICNIQKIPQAIVLIFESAFRPRALTGGAVGTVMITIQKGVARGIFTNEAGLGSASIAAAAARTREPARQGLVCMTGTFIDTVVICSMTGLAIVLTGAWNTGRHLEGVEVTTYAFQSGLPFSSHFSAGVLMVCLVFFAFATILGWNYYAERCLEYLARNKRKAIRVFRWLYILAVFLGPYLSVEAVWNLADVTNGLMALPNLVALIALNGVVVRETKSFQQRAEGLPRSERTSEKRARGSVPKGDAV